MKREILRISDLNYRQRECRRLKHFSVYSGRGMCRFFSVFLIQEKNFLVSLLTGKVEGASGKFSFSIDAQKVDQQ